MSVYGRAVDIGKTRRLQRFFSNGKCVLVPLDDSLISGPKDGLYDIESKLEQIERSRPSALMAFSGTMSLTRLSQIPFILNLTASTIMGQHTNKVLISSVERAIALGADAVALHINFSSKYESEMLHNVKEVKEKCDMFGMPMMILAYPRKECNGNGIGVDEDYNYIDIKHNNNIEYTDLVCHCVRVAFELGADIIKAQYTGDQSSFERVIRSAAGVPVLIAGGKPESIPSLFSMVEDATKAGASGVSIGRYVFNSKYSDIVIRIIKEIVFEGMTAKEAECYYQNEIL